MKSFRNWAWILYFPGILLAAKNGFTEIEICYDINKIMAITFDNPIIVNYFPGCQK